MLELKEERGIYRCFEEIRGRLKLVRSESGADTTAERGPVPQWCGARHGSAAVAPGLASVAAAGNHCNFF